MVDRQGARSWAMACLLLMAVALFAQGTRADANDPLAPAALLAAMESEEAAIVEGVRAEDFAAIWSATHRLDGLVHQLEQARKNGQAAAKADPCEDALRKLKAYNAFLLPFMWNNGGPTSFDSLDSDIAELESDAAAYNAERERCHAAQGRAAKAEALVSGVNIHPKPRAPDLGSPGPGDRAVQIALLEVLETAESSAASALRTEADGDWLKAIRSLSEVHDRQFEALREADFTRLPQMECLKAATALYLAMETGRLVRTRKASLAADGTLPKSYRNARALYLERKGVCLRALDLPATRAAVVLPEAAL
jgi:hypothetical protein